MKLAVLSDIHGNLPALQAVVEDIDGWRPDVVVVNGDIVNRGPSSGACFELLLERQQRDKWRLLRGNHEDFVLDCSRPDAPQSGPEFDVRKFAYFALWQLGENARVLTTLPEIYEADAPFGDTLRVVHASMRSNRDGIYPVTPEAEIRKQIEPAPAVFVTGHTHRPLVRHIDQTLVVNIGAVGSPFDNDRRAGYGRFTSNGHTWRAEIVRLDYDYRHIERDYLESGFLEEGGPLAQLMLVELRKAHGLIFRWASRYEEAVLTGRMTLEDSVRQLLTDEDLRPFTGPPGWTI
ncbi:MAG: metallophosphoesterase family protein [Chloroflexota bacterium]|jgi:predicted phosphodiesterase